MRRLLLALLTAVLFVGASPSAQSGGDTQTVDDIRRALLRLPYYGVFDFMAFQYEKGTVTLSGFLYQRSLKREAVAALKRVPRVDQVVEKLEELPASQNDDRIRWRTFDRIYDDPALSRYAAGGGVTRFDRRFDMPRFPGMQPFGTYAIHIIVKRGHTLLIGEVDSEFDKTVAGLRAREVPGTFGVDNELLVAARKAR
jgi:hyperosmotically inducible periplasmic protein